MLADVFHRVFEVISYDLAASMCGHKFKSGVILQSHKILNTAYHLKMMCSAPRREQNDNLQQYFLTQLSDKATV